MYHATIDPKQQGKRPWTNTSETMSQNKPFFIIYWFSQVFCHRYLSQKQMKTWWKTNKNPMKNWLTQILVLVRSTSLHFWCCDQISERNNLKKERFILAHSFREFSPKFSRPLLWVWSKAEHHSWKGVIDQNCLPYGSQEVEKQRERGPGKDISPKDIFSMTYLFQWGPTYQKYHQIMNL
jgi:hypothetical protein